MERKSSFHGLIERGKVMKVLGKATEIWREIKPWQRIAVAIILSVALWAGLNVKVGAAAPARIYLWAKCQGPGGLGLAAKYCRTLDHGGNRSSVASPLTKGRGAWMKFHRVSLTVDRVSLLCTENPSGEVSVCYKQTDWVIQRSTPYR